MIEEKENKTVTISFRATEDLKKQIEAMAAAENRNTSNMIVVLLQKGLKEKK